jgi:hypothetical protein
MITEENYRSRENEIKYMTYSQFNNFMDCEASALAMIEGSWQIEQTIPMLVGQYVEACFSGEKELFESLHPEMFKKTGDKGLLRDFAIAEKMVKRAERDTVFMSFLTGKQQVIKTGKICGVPVKTKTDFLIPEKRIVDLKTVKDFSLQWTGREKVPFIESRRYDIQAYFYESVQEKFVPYYIAAITKETEPDIEVFEIPYERINQVGTIVQNLIDRYADIKEHKIIPTRCECCDYCKRTKKLTGPIDYRERKWN